MSKKGVPKSEQHKLKIKTALLGKKKSNEHIENLRFSHVGKKRSIESRKKQSEKMSGKNNPMYGKKHTEEARKKMSEKITGFKHSDEVKLKQRIRMLNGLAAYANKFIKNPSKPEVVLREIVRSMFPNCEFQYQVFNYSLDIAIPFYKIAIEYDGWYHFNCQENIDYHTRRQEEIEEVGWKFIRYNIFNKFPNKDKIKCDIERLINDS